MSLNDHPVTKLAGSAAAHPDYAGVASLLVNVASKCGLTPQYTGLEEIQKQYAAKGFSVLGVPCNQFMGQEPGTAEEIREFCSTTYGVTFPMFAKIDVNGDDRDPLYAELETVPDADGYTGDIRWNFEKFLVAPGGEVVARFAPQVEPDAPEVIAAIEANLPGPEPATVGRGAVREVGRTGSLACQAGRRPPA